MTGVSAFGLFVELVEPFVEGLVHLSTLADDEYRYLESAHAIHGVRRGGCTGSATASVCGS